MTDKTESVFYDFANPARTLYLSALEARGATLKNGKKSEPKFEATVMLAPDGQELAGLRAAIVKAAMEKFPGRDIVSEIKAGVFNTPLKDGTQNADKEKAKGKDHAEPGRGFKLFKTTSKYAPKLVIIQNGQLLTLDDEQLRKAHAAKFYPGVEVGLTVEFVPYEKLKDNENDGVSARLWTIVSLNRGDKLGNSGKGASTEVFKHYAGLVSDEAPSEGMASANSDW